MVLACIDVSNHCLQLRGYEVRAPGLTRKIINYSVKWSEEDDHWKDLSEAPLVECASGARMQYMKTCYQKLHGPPTEGYSQKPE